MQTKTGEVLGKILRGTVHRQFKKCGKSNCKCARGELHQTFYHFVRINGKLKARYLKASEVELIQLACAARQREQKDRRRRALVSWHRLRGLRAELREFRNLYKL